MNITAKLFLDDRRTKKDGTQTIKLKIRIDRKPIEISMKRSINPKYWDDTNQRVKTRCPQIENTTRFNNSIEKKKAVYIDHIIELEDSGELAKMSLKEIKDILTGKASKRETKLLSYFKMIISNLELAGNVGNAAVYRNAHNSIAEFLRQKDMPLKHVTFKWLEKYEVWYLAKGNKRNGLGVNLRTLRAVINKAIKNKDFSRDDYPFAEYKIEKEKTRKRAVSESDIELIKAYRPRTKRQEWAQDYFMMSYYLMGTSFADLAFLKVKNITGGRIEFMRQKGGKDYSIKITSGLQAILDKYLDDKKAEDYILNIIKLNLEQAEFLDIKAKQNHIQYEIGTIERPYEIKITPDIQKKLDHNRTGKSRAQYLNRLVMIDQVKRQRKRMKNALKRFNASLREITVECGIKSDITSYVARHSFATVAKFKGVPVEVISQALGHTNVRTTEIYLSEFGSDIMDAFHEKIVGQ